MGNRRTAIQLFSLIVFCCAYFTLGGISHAHENQMVLEAGFKKVEALRFVQYLRDVEGNITVQDLIANREVLKDNASVSSAQTRATIDWIQLSKEQRGFGYVDSPYWFHLDVVNRDAEHRHWLAEIAYSMLDKVDFYIV